MDIQIQISSMQELRYDGWLEVSIVESSAQSRKLKP